MHVEKPTKEHTAALYQFCTQYCEKAKINIPLEKEFAQNYADALQNTNRILRLAFDEQQLIGLLDATVQQTLPSCTKAMTLQAIYVSTEHRGKGAGRGLLMAAFAVAKQAHVHELNVLASRVGSTLQTFLERNGFAKKYFGYAKKI